MIRAAVAADAEAISAIYNHYVLHTTVTFEDESLLPGQMRDRIRSVTARLPWLVFERDGEVVGYSYADTWHGRPAYRHSVEATIYLHPEATGRGTGTALYRSLLDRLAGLSLHRVVGVIALPNPASVALHERLGFEKVGHLGEVGRKHGRWIDVGWWLRGL